MKPAVLLVVSLAVLGHFVRADLKKQQILSAAAFEFAQKLHQKVASDQQNVVFSPASVHAALTMTSLGARGETASEMVQLLSLQALPGSDAHDTYREILNEMSLGVDVKITSGKGILVGSNKSIEQDYKNDVENKYLSKVENINLSAPGGPEKEMNEFIANKTQDVVKDIISKDEINNETSLHVVAATAINGTWQDQFEKNATQKQDFYHLNGTKSKVDMMNDTRSILHKRDNVSGVDIVQLPFKGGRYALYIALPQRMDGITDLEKQLTKPGKADELFENLSPSYVQVVIPKFKIESNFRLNASLKEMGLVKAVTPGVADFSGISKAGNLSITEVVHRAVIDVQEWGVVMPGSSAPESDSLFPVIDEANEKFLAHHPFLFFVRDNQSKVVLFQGKYSG